MNRYSLTSSIHAIPGFMPSTCRAAISAASWPLRNAILHIEHRLRRGESRALIGELTEERLNVDGRGDRLYTRYLRPRMMEILTPLHGMRGAEADYFHRFLTFTAREQFRAKVGDDRADSPGGFSETWCCDTLTKQQNGNILTGLKLHPVPTRKVPSCGWI